MRKNKPLIINFIEDVLLSNVQIGVIVIQSMYQRAGFVRSLQNYYQLKYPKWTYDYSTHMLRNPDTCSNVIICIEPSVERLRGMQIDKALIQKDLHLRDYIKNSVMAPNIARKK